MTDRRAARHHETRREILDAAWDLAERAGIAGLTLRELASEVDMRAPSLYTYFASKDALYDAMFEDANQALIDAVARWENDEPADIDPEERLIRGTEEWMRFCQESVARYQLLFTRAVPGWEPSDQAYARAEDAYGSFARAAAAAGIIESADLDLYTAVTGGLAAQQMANDPQGDRWRQLVPRAVRMILTDVRKDDRT